MPSSVSSIGRRSRRVHENTADTVAILIDGDSEVAFLAPVGTPGVSDDKELLAALVAITDGGDSVVKVMTASLTVHDTLVVELEDRAGCVDTDAGGLLFDGGLDLLDALLGDSGVGLD